MYLIFDTETTGLPLNYKAPVTALDNWPRVVQIAWLRMDDTGTEHASVETIIRPDGFTIPGDAAALHGITTERALAEGVPIVQALESFREELGRAETLVAHNMAFDEKVLGAEFLRSGLPNALEGVPRLCTMEGSTQYCRIPGRNGYKWPRLDELHRRLFGEGFAGAHTALADVRACARCLLELRRRHVM